MCVQVEEMGLVSFPDLPHLGSCLLSPSTQGLQIFTEASGLTLLSLSL